MSNWTAGYAAEVDYTFGYFKELNPLNTRLALLDAGFQPPQGTTACELGFGQGLSIAIHAAGSKTQWYGTDYSPNQAGFAQSMAQSAGVLNQQAWLTDQSFAEFANRDDLPDFDFIGLHGIWTWVSDENRRILVDFIHRKLKVGGLLYISYNTQAGWAAMMPIRHLLNQHAKMMSPQGASPVARIMHAFDFTDKLLNLNPTYLKANPQIRAIFDQIKQQNPTYLAHEYFSADWKPFPFSEMAKELDQAKLEFACSANTLDQIDALNLSEAEEDLINTQQNSLFRETLRDLCTNQLFRKDYWIKGAQKLDQFEQMEQLFALRFVLIQLRSEVDLTVKGALGESQLNPATYEPILDFFADYQVKTFQQLVQAMAPQGIGFEKIMQALLILTAKDILHPAQTETEIEQARPKTRKLNAFLMKKSRGTDELVHLASPVTGGGIPIMGYEMLFMLALQFGHQQPRAMAEFAWGLIKQRGMQLFKQGKWLETDEDNIQELIGQVEFFMTEPYRLYQALGILD
jgi:SAM-dependent methyltransferase